MTELRGCWDVSKNRRTHYIRSIEGQGGAAVPESVAGTVSQLGRVVLWVSIELYSSQASPRLCECLRDRSRREDGVDPFWGNGSVQGLGDLLHPRKNVFGLELIG